MVTAEIIAVGSELVSGQRLDTNSQWISQRLGEIGVPVDYHTTLGDDLDHNVDAINTALRRVGLVILTGGLGPTQDDLTREALARVANVALVEDPESLAAIEALFARRNRPMASRNRLQALLPQGAMALPNPVGTAPGIWLEIQGVTVVALPGVPSEMKVMFQEQLLPRLRARGLGRRVLVHRTINLFGRGESDIEADAMDLTQRGRRPEVGITAHDATISFRVSCEAQSEAEALALIEPDLTQIRQRFGTLVVGEGEGQDVSEALAALLLSRHRTIAVAESCTGGLIAARLTAIAGVSEVFLGGVVSYSNEAKAALLGVPLDLIRQHGAVSAEVAAAMADGVARRFGSDLALSVTGIAGPGGGTPEKPVGLVYLGMVANGKLQTRRLDLGPEQPRDVIRSRAAKHAMNWARLALLEEPVGDRD